MNFDRIDGKQTLAERVCDTITNRIIEGQIPAGEALPTEPELADQFGVSRAVVRDACRMLMARGLVDIRHGKGMFVTGSQTRAFGEALFTALRREGSTVWDVEQYEMIWFPEVFALASEHMSPELYEEILDELERHLDVFAELTRKVTREKRDITENEQRAIIDSFQPVLKLILSATGNKLISLIGLSLRRLRGLRNWEVGLPDDPEESIKKEREIHYKMIETLRMEDPEEIRNTMQRLMTLPDNAIEAMKKTPLGDVVRIS